MLDARDWPTEGVPVAELREHAREALLGFYTGNEYEFWPKKEYLDQAPEEVRIVDANGSEIARYDVQDAIADTRRQLVGIKNA
jgi:hypothetical protein